MTVLTRGIIARAHGYTYTIFGLEASHPALSRGKALDKSLPGPAHRAWARGSLMRTTGGECEKRGMVCDHMCQAGAADVKSGASEGY
jgi:hypothetical protein